MITIEELAKKTGFSPTTVSIVLRGKARERQISDKTAQMILDTANSLGYRPNIAARSLREGQGALQMQLAVFWAQDFRAGMLVRFLEGLRRRLRETERDIRLVVFPYENDALSQCRPLVSASDCHAAIVCNASRADMDFLESRVLPLPVVLYNRFSRGYCSVNVDDEKMGVLAARALIESGCRKLSVLTNPRAFEGMAVRERSFREAARLAGVEVGESVLCESSISGGDRAMQKILSAGDPPDGFFCAGSSIAHGALHALNQAGVAVPQRCRLVAVGNGPEEEDEFALPPLSVVRLPMEDMAAACLDLVLDVSDGKLTPPQSRLLPVEYIARGTCGALKG